MTYRAQGLIDFLSHGASWRAHFPPPPPRVTPPKAERQPSLSDDALAVIDALCERKTSTAREVLASVAPDQTIPQVCGNLTRLRQLGYVDQWRIGKKVTWWLTDEGKRVAIAPQEGVSACHD